MPTKPKVVEPSSPSHGPALATRNSRRHPSDTRRMLERRPVVLAADIPKVDLMPEAWIKPPTITMELEVPDIPLDRDQNRRSTKRWPSPTERRPPGSWCPGAVSAPGAGAVPAIRAPEVMQVPAPLPDLQHRSSRPLSGQRGGPRAASVERCETRERAGSSLSISGDWLTPRAAPVGLVDGFVDAAHGRPRGHSALEASPSSRLALSLGDDASSFSGDSMESILAAAAAFRGSRTATQPAGRRR